MYTTALSVFGPGTPQIHGTDSVRHWVLHTAVVNGELGLNALHIHAIGFYPYCIQHRNMY